MLGRQVGVVMLVLLAALLVLPAGVAEAQGVIIMGLPSQGAGQEVEPAQGVIAQ